MAQYHCYFSTDLATAYRAEWSTGKSLRHSTAYHCYYCSSYYIQKARYLKYIERCSGIPGIVYNSTNETFVSFQDNIDNKGDLPLAAFMDFETTAPAEHFLTPKQNEMLVVSFILIFAFHLKLNLNRVVVQRSFGYSLLKLAMVDYITEGQLKFVDKDLINWLKDCAINASERRCKNVVAQMFAIELKFASNCLLNLHQIVYNPVDWKNTKCVICNFPLIINAKSPNVPANEMNYTDFYIRYEHKFLRNILKRRVRNVKGAEKSRVLNMTFLTYF